MDVKYVYDGSVYIDNTKYYFDGVIITLPKMNEDCVLIGGEIKIYLPKDEDGRVLINTDGYWTESDYLQYEVDNEYIAWFVGDANACDDYSANIDTAYDLLKEAWDLIDNNSTLDN